jgi:PAS domain S-box-containing protein
VLLLSAIPYALAELHVALRAGNVHNADVVFAHATELVARLVPFVGISLYFAGRFQRELETSRRMEEIVEELLRVRKRFDQLTQNIREVFWISSSEGSDIIYVSPAYEDIFGMGPETLYADPGAFLQLVHPDDRDVMADLTVRMVVEPFEVEYRVRRPDGELRWLQTRGFPVRDEHGEVYRVAGVTEDITEHKLAEEALRRSEARIRALFQAIPDLALRLNRGGVVLDYHGRGRIAAVPPPEEFLGKRVTDLLPELEGRLSEALARALDGRAVESIEFRVERGPAPVELEARIVRSAEDEALVLLRNITDQRRLESEVLDVSHREQLRIGHDLHDGILQQLTGIALLSRVLQQQLESRGLAQHERARQIRELVEETIGQTRSLIRGLAPVELEQGNLSAALEQLALRAERFNDVSCVCRSEDVVLADPTVATHLYRIAQEAVSNALKHAAPSKIEISLERRGSKYRLAVRDDGTGFDPGRAGASIGMGLHILHYRARKVDAELEVRSAEGGGTEITCAWSVPSAKRPAAGRGLAPTPGSWG